MSETIEMKPASEEEVREALYDVVDPELGIDVVNLGLIYGIHIDDANIATIDMTLTSAACPLTDVIEDQAKSATDGIVNELRINWVWMPPWGPDKITDDGREQLRALGLQRLSPDACTCVAPGSAPGATAVSGGQSGLPASAAGAQPKPFTSRNAESAPVGRPWSSRHSRRSWKLRWRR